MAGQKSSAPKWLRHRTLITAEAVLLVGAGQQLVQQQIETLGLPNWGRVLFTMASTLGILGGVVLLVKAFATRGVSQSHNVAKALPIPAATWLLHAAACCGLFALYAIVWHLPVDVPVVGVVGAPAPK
jgi:hypothetical protein